MSFYKYVTKERNDTPQLMQTMEDTVKNLAEKDSDGESPKMLLGKIQSDKTRAFIGVIALTFDLNYDVAIILTKNSKALVEQTAKRMYRAYADPIKANRVYIYDVMHIPGELSGFIRSRKLVIIAKKEDDNLKRLSNLTDVYPDLATKNVLIVDDEADYASVTYYPDGNKKENVRFGKLAEKISSFRGKIKGKCDFLQVIATPYSLFLQPEKISIDSIGYAPLRPSFTTILHPHAAYVGGEYYFESSQEPDSPAANVYIETNPEEFERLKKPHLRC